MEPPITTESVECYSETVALQHRPQAILDCALHAVLATLLALCLFDRSTFGKYRLSLHFRPATDVFRATTFTNTCYQARTRLSCRSLRVWIAHIVVRAWLNSIPDDGPVKPSSHPRFAVARRLPIFILRLKSKSRERSAGSRSYTHLTSHSLDSQPVKWHCCTG